MMNVSFLRKQIEVITRTSFVFLIAYEIGQIQKISNLVNPFAPTFHFYTVENYWFFFLVLFLFSQVCHLFRGKLQQKSYVLLSLPLYLGVIFLVPVAMAVKLVLFLMIIVYLFPLKKEFKLTSYFFSLAIFLAGFFFNQGFLQRFSIVLGWLNFLDQLLSTYETTYQNVLQYAVETPQFSAENLKVVSQDYLKKRFIFPVLFGGIGILFLFFFQGEFSFSGFHFKETTPLKMPSPVIEEAVSKVPVENPMEQLLKSSASKPNPYLEKFWQLLSYFFASVFTLGSVYFLVIVLKKDYLQSFKELFARKKERQQELNNKENNLIHINKKEKVFQKSARSWQKKLRRQYQKAFKKTENQFSYLTPVQLKAYLSGKKEPQQEVTSYYEKIRYQKGEQTTKEDYQYFKKLLEKLK